MSRPLVLVASLALLLLISGPGHGQEAAGEQITNLDQLLDSVRQTQQQQRALNAQREQEFIRDNARQKELMAQARRDLERRQRENQPLLAVTENNKVEIAALQSELKKLVQEVGDLASTFQEFAGDFSAVMQESMITSQYPQRTGELRALAAADTQPTIDQIEALWLLLQQEMTEAGKVALYATPVVLADGTTQQREVLRVGTFSAYADGDFLRYVPETGELLLLSRQPAARFRDEARNFALQSDGVAPITVDPTRGSLLGMLAYTPSLRERIEQGGSIGLIILFLGAFGLLLTIWRTLYLVIVYLRMQAQVRNIDTPNASNPLGRVLSAVQGVALEEEELLELKLDEAVLAEIPALERGNGLIKLLAATSPLLGLLGTVTGMILTFQAISLFGTGDPKLMAGGISQALVTTVLGLVVAIPLLFGHSLINALSRSMIQRLDEQCAGVLARNADLQAGN
ncbi:MAG: MotA/TolQ/ExbB proton channel family protein [Pseudomonadales bacterium]|nr:MotA/TolQ/ExbB proton channel family protein [Halioglobus sp.]MCP5129740.1 MotA/TolQ/ExbB proton channel family protein [Pseudomonadales bacterium]